MQEHSVFTWNPVDARWIHERGPEMTTPPIPPDVHAIQTYFFDPDGNRIEFATLGGPPPANRVCDADGHTTVV